MMKFMQKLGKSLMLPVACLPIAGLMMGIGYLLAPAVMGAAGATEGFAYVTGFLLIKAGAALIDNMNWLFAVGVAVGMSKDHDGVAALAGLVSFLMFTTLLAPGTVTTIMPSVAADAVKSIAFGKINNAFIAIIAGMIGAVCYDKYKSQQLPDWAAFFSGKRFVAMATAVYTICASVVLLFAWPVIFGALYAIGNAVASMGGIGAGIYAFLNRLLIPTGLHHALNQVFWFDTIGLGDLSHYWAGETSADVTWSLGMYMSGFFAPMMFGIPGAALAIVQCAKDKSKAIGIVLSAAVCAFVCGVTEPFEFAFMFLAFPLYIVYAVLYGIFTVVAYYVNFRAGFCFSAGVADLIFSASLPAASNTWMILPMGVAAFVVFYLVFRVMITKFDYMTPGREDDAEDETKIELANNDYTGMAAVILEGLGGKDNVAEADHCATRLRLEVKDMLLVDDKKIKSSGVSGVMRPGKTSVQVIVGPKVQFVFDELKKML